MGTRREFIRLSGGLALGSVLAQYACTPGKKNSSGYDNTSGNRLAAFGIQLYSLRDVMPKDPQGVLEQVASFGYRQIESYEGPQGMFWGMGNTGFKKKMDELGMTIVSSHCDINKEFEKKAAEAAAIGMKYLVCPWIGPQKSISDYRKMAGTFNQRGAICKKEGIRFAYHNHDYSFKAIDGEIPQDVLMKETDPALVDFQMDIYWVVTAGQDPVTWLEKYPGRFTLSHVKDRAKGATTTDASCDLGTGSIDFPMVLKAAKKNGMIYYVVEQERYPNGTSMEAAKKNAEFMRRIEI